MLQAGEHLAGYRIEAIAGVGGMGVVYRATQLSLERRVALKVLSTTLVGNHRFRERFRLEGRHAAALDHPNIIPVYEAGESNGLMFIAMRFVDGPTLADLVVQEAITGAETVRILGAIASALDAAHESGLVHRDVKPQNVLLTAGGHPYLADFGITKGAHAGLTHSGDFVGSVSYVSPEQIDGRDTTAASDVYSLAAVLFHCLTGTLPYEHDTEAALMHAHLFAPPATAGALGFDVPAELDEVFVRGMAKAPDERYASASALVEAARSALERLAPEALDRCPPLVPRGAPVAAPAPAPGLPDPSPAPYAAASPHPAALPLPLPPPVPAGGQTAADQRREPPSPEPEDGPTRRQRIVRATLAGCAIAAIVAAPVAGALVGDGDDPAPPRQRASQTLALTYQAPWTPDEPTIPGLELDDVLGLRHPDGTILVAGRMREPDAGFDPLPAALRRRLADKAESEPVRLARRTAVRYTASTRSGGGELWLAAFPDSKGWTAVACHAVKRRPDRACSAVAATFKVTGATPVELGPDERVAKRLSGAIRTLNAARRSLRPALGAASVPRRASAASRLARAHRGTATSIAALKLRPQEQPLFSTLGRALTKAAAVLERLAKASRQRRRIDYDEARGDLRGAERGLRSALARMRAGGYGAS